MIKKPYQERTRKQFLWKGKQFIAISNLWNHYHDTMVSYYELMKIPNIQKMIEHNFNALDIVVD